VTIVLTESVLAVVPGEGAAVEELTADLAALGICAHQGEELGTSFSAEALEVRVGGHVEAPGFGKGAERIDLGDWETGDDELQKLVGELAP
jgi:hypothetical protein